MPASFYSTFYGPELTESDFCDPLSNLSKSLLVKHMVSEDAVDYMAELFFGAPVALSSYSAVAIADIDTYIKNRICGVNHVDLVVDFTNTADNSEIILSPVDTKYYEFSLAFFNAILTKYDVANIKEFRFSKTVSAFGNMDGNSIAFKVIDNGGKVLYCGDMSGLRP